MKIKELIKSELSGWKTFEVVMLSFVFLIIIVNALIVKDNIIAVVSAFCGILYSTIAGKGKVSCYFFGLTGTGCYSWLSFVNGLWGNLLLYMCYYLPMQIIGIFSWSKNLNKKREIKKRCLTIRERIIYFSLAFVFCCLAVFVLKLMNGSSPFCDGVTTVLSIFGMYFTVKRCIEQWHIWMIVNGLSSIMWLNLVINGSKTYSTFIMWVVYFVLSVYFYFEWKKELKQNLSEKNS